ncbi:MAG: TrkA C-terminal domain-containing protein [Spirochaetia bacterium]
MAALVSFFAVLTISMIIVRIATVMLTLTGVSPESARFQARSAFTGTGFTTSEAEAVVGHPVRRRIIMVLMLSRSAGFVTVLSSLILSFVGNLTSTQVGFRAAVLAGGIFILFLLSKSKLIDMLMRRMIQWALKTWTKLHIADYDSLLNLSGSFSVIELRPKEDSWLVGKTLEDLHLPDEGILVLGIRRANGQYLGTPLGSTYITNGDTLIMYGKEDALHSIGDRPAGEAGNKAHKRWVEKQQEAKREVQGLVKKKPGFLGRILGKKVKR